MALLAVAGLLVTGAAFIPVGPDEAPVVAAADLTLSGALLIRRVELLEVEGRRDLRLPVSGTTAREYADVRILSRRLRDEMLGTFLARGMGRERGRPGVVDFAVGEPRRLGSPARLANVDVVFSGELAVTLGIRRFGGGCKVLYPERRAESGARVRVFEIADPALRSRVEKAVLARWGRTVPLAPRPSGG